MTIRRTEDETISRRNFLKAAVATAAVATATGAGAAILVNQGGSDQVIISSASPAGPPMLPNVAISAAPSEPTELLARLAAAQAENVRLQAALEASERRLVAAQQNQDQNALTETLQLQLGEANNRITVLTGLVALYQQLENIDVAGVVDNGLTAVTGVLRNLLQKANQVAQGAAHGREALTQFEAQIPLVENGRHWLLNQLNRLTVIYQAVEQALRTLAEKTGSLLAMLNEWFQDVLKWLPFGMGRNASQIMQTLSNLVSEMPTTIAGLRINVVQPLDVWLAGAGEEMPLRRNLINPLREQAFKPAGEIVTEAESVQATYQEELAAPIQSAIYNQRVLRELIAEYREQHQI